MGWFFLRASVIREANYILRTRETIREAALHLGLSKSVLHRHMSDVLKKEDYELYLKIKNIFFEHNKYRHIKGGLATKNKYAFKG